MNDYKEKLAKLPSNVRDYLDSYKGSELNLLICQQNGLKGIDVGKNTDLVVDLFFKDLKLEELLEKIKEIFKFSDSQAKKLAADIAGIRLLVVDDWFDNKVSKYLAELGSSAENYKKIVEEQELAVKKEKEEDAKDLMEEKLEKERLLKQDIVSNKEESAVVEKDFNIDWEKEKAEVISVFNNGLAGILLTKELWLEDFNDVLVYLLLEKGDSFRDEIERLLLANKENLTEKHFSLSGHLVEPTISNWLNYFITQKGTDNFDNLTLTNFIINSPATKNLKEEEKNIVKKLLLFYRNLKFFPDSMPNDESVDWQIIPFEKQEETGALSEAKVRLEKEKEIINQPALERAKKIAELRGQADLYDARSLERRAIEEEIKKLE